MAPKVAAALVLLFFTVLLPVSAYVQDCDPTCDDTSFCLNGRCLYSGVYCDPPDYPCSDDQICNSNHLCTGPILNCTTACPTGQICGPWGVCCAPLTTDNCLASYRC